MKRRDWAKLDKIISLATRERGLAATTIPLILSGDLHHYAHHVEEGAGRHYVISGGAAPSHSAQR